MYEQMRLPGTKAWEYDEDTGTVMCRCPDCGGRLTISVYIYANPYKFCPYCGEKLLEGRITKKRIEVYKFDPEREERGRSLTIEYRGMNEKQRLMKDSK